MLLEMASFVVWFLVLVGCLSSVRGANLSRSSFPKGFIFGTASAAYQFEGAWKEGGKGPSIWDTYTHQHPEKIQDHSNGDIAVGSYHRYKEDVRIMKNMGLDAHRFSISWARILPRGNLRGGVNNEGIRYYNNLINELISNGMQPWVALFHWDTPQTLEDEYGGFLSPNIVEDFRDYANICFREFGDRVKHWVTINEPHSYSFNGYARGILPPGRCSPWEVGKCSVGNSATEPYLVGHHFLLAHAAAVQLYRVKYQAHQKGVIGIQLVCHWMVPFSSSKSDKDAAQRAMDFMLGWYMDPLVRGEYPRSMISNVGNRLPQFTEEQSRMVIGSFDFIGLNYYTARYVVDIPPSSNHRLSYSTDSRANLTESRNGKLIGPQGASIWLFVYPRGLRHLLLYIKKKYNNPLIYVMENGFDEFNNKSLSLEEALQDPKRKDYFSQHLKWVHRAIIREDVNVRGYFAWSLLDNYEWIDGYTCRFGFYFVDYKNDLKRYPKHSAIWFQNFLKG